MSSADTAQVSDFLQRMATASHARCSAAKRSASVDELTARAGQAASVVPLRLSSQGFDLIAEVKKKSPSAGRLARKALDPKDQATAYATAGAAAISVLTEPDAFDGSLEDLSAVATACEDVPVMRKDFLVDSYQVLEARAAGASGVLLIAAILESAVLQDMLATTRRLGMFALVEAFDAADIDKCLPLMRDAEATDADGVTDFLVGINCRSLRTLKVEFNRFAQLADRLPDQIPWVAESGIAEPGDAKKVAQLGYRAALVGTSLMGAADPAAYAAAIIAAGRH